METSTQTYTNGGSKEKKPMPDWIFVLWAGGTALLSYSLVYALRKPFTAAEFEGLQVFGMDYKIVVSIIQLLGYVSAKLLGIKYISELRPEGRLKFIIGSAALSEISLIAFGLLPMPYNIMALYFNGLSLGCMWGVIFSFLEGRRTTDILASIMGVSMALSSGVAKSLGLYTLNVLHVSEFYGMDIFVVGDFQEHAPVEKADFSLSHLTGTPDISVHRLSGRDSPLIFLIGFKNDFHRGSQIQNVSGMQIIAFGRTRECEIRHFQAGKIRGLGNLHRHCPAFRIYLHGLLSFHAERQNFGIDMRISHVILFQAGSQYCHSNDSCCNISCDSHFPFSLVRFRYWSPVGI